MIIDVNGIILLLGAISLLIVNVINAWKSNTKLDIIHQQTNSQLESLKKELADVTTELTNLKITIANKEIAKANHLVIE